MPESKRRKSRKLVDVRPRVRCPHCHRIIAITRNKSVHRYLRPHNQSQGKACPMSGHMVGQHVPYANPGGQ